ncbi:MAG: MFS transporter [Eggerthellaceae bacterium]|nr:MFS transporter [Eggerthellaceae bacterium]
MAEARSVKEGDLDIASNANVEGETSERLWTPLFVMIIAATLCAFMVGQGTNAGTSVYVDIIGGSSTLAGVGAAVFSGAAAIARLIMGPIIDSKGRVCVMAFGGVFLIAGTLGPVLLTDLSFFMLWRLLQGVGFAAATTASATAAADILPMARLGEGIGYHGLGQALSMAVGPALALFLVHTDPAENLYLGLSAAALLAFVFAVLCRYEKNPSKLPKTSAYRMRWEESSLKTQASKGSGSFEGSEASAGLETEEKPKASVKLVISSVFEKKALPGTIPMLVMTPAFGFSIYFAGVLGSSLGLANAGLYYTLSAVSMIVVRLNSKRFMDSVAPIKLATIATLFGVLGFGMLAIASMQVLPVVGTEWAFCLAGLPYGLFLGIMMPVNQTVAVKNTPPERWGAANALYLLAIDVGIGAVCVVWGMLNDAFGYTAAIVCAIAFMVIAYGVAWICYPARDKQWRKR